MLRYNIYNATPPHSDLANSPYLRDNARAHYRTYRS